MKTGNVSMKKKATHKLKSSQSHRQDFNEERNPSSRVGLQLVQRNHRHDIIIQNIHMNTCNSCLLSVEHFDLSYDFLKYKDNFIFAMGPTGHIFSRSTYRYNFSDYAHYFLYLSV